MFIEMRNPNNYNTELYNTLKSLPREILHHNDYELREPLGIYSVSISRVFRAFKNILDKLQKLNPDLEEIDLAHKELLDSIMAFIDDGYLIMKCLYSKSVLPENIIFADKCLEKVDKLLIKNHKENIFPYRNKVALIANKTKHNHARYCHVELSTNLGKVLGYYIEGVDNKGTIIPNKEIHPDYNGVHTAISYNKDIREQIANVYFISHYISDAIVKIVMKNYNISLNIGKYEYDSNNEIIEIFNRVNSLKTLFFPDEYEDLTQIIVKEDCIQIRKPAYKSYVNKLYEYDSSKVRTTISGDGTTLSWALPYFQKSKSN